MLGLVHRHLRLFTRHSFCRTFSSTSALLMISNVAPPVHRISENAKSIDKHLFRKSVPVLAVRIPATKASSFITGMKKSILALPQLRPVVLDKGNSENRLVLLKYQNKDELPAEAVDFIEKEGATLIDYDLELDYGYWSADDILQATLPEELVDNAPSGYAAMGHMAHLNLNEEYLPYKYIIGQVILDKNPRIRTVVNKLDTIHTQFRVFDMELIAGEPDFVVQHIESNCRFTFDFREVYWNSRLQKEHDRLIQLFQPKDGVVVDVMAGVGPFAIPAAKKGCAVLANDLNPSCAKWLLKNAVDNDVVSNIRVYCEDGRDFIRSSAERALTAAFPEYTGVKSKRQKQREGREKRRKKTNPGTAVRSRSPTPSKHPMRSRIAHFVMNLPDSAIEFLDAFLGMWDPSNKELSRLYETMPLVHCYCFTRFLDPHEAEADIRERAEAALGGKLEEDVSLHCVRSVAPNKDMYCISFRLPRSIAFLSSSGTQ